MSENEIEREPKCADLVVGKLDDRLDNLREMWEAYCDPDNDDNYTEDGECLNEYGLSFDYVKPHTFCDCDSDYPDDDCDDTSGYWRYQLSYGGPSDEFRFHDDGTIEYRYHDWFDGAGRNLRGADYRFMEELVESIFGLTYQRGKYVQEW